MPIQPQTLAAFRELVVATGKLDVATRKLDKEVTKRKTKVKEALDANDTTLLDIQRKALEGDLKDAQELLREANRQLVDNLEKVKADEAFMRERDDDATKVAEIVARARSAAATHYKTLKDLQNQADAGWRQSVRDERYALRQLAGDEASMTELKEELLAAWKKALDFDDMAASARARRDAKGLANARAAMAKLDVATLRIRVDIAGKVLARNEKDFGDRDIADDTLKTLKDGYADVRRAYEAAQEKLDQIDAIDKRMAALSIQAIDVKKAREAMGLDAKADGQLKKVFDGPPAGWEKGLDAVGKAFKTGTTGRKYLESLRGAGIVPE